MGGPPTAMEKEADLFKILDILGPVESFCNSSSGVVVWVCDEASLRGVIGKAVGGEGTLLKEYMKQLRLLNGRWLRQRCEIADVVLKTASSLIPKDSASICSADSNVYQRKYDSFAIEHLQKI